MEHAVPPVYTLSLLWLEKNVAVAVDQVFSGVRALLVARLSARSPPPLPSGCTVSFAPPPPLRLARCVP